MHKLQGRIKNLEDEVDVLRRGAKHTDYYMKVKGKSPYNKGRSKTPKKNFLKNMPKTPNKKQLFSKSPYSRKIMSSSNKKRDIQHSATPQKGKSKSKPKTPREKSIARLT